MSSENEMFDELEDKVLCPMCQKSSLNDFQIPDFIVCDYCQLKLRTEISLDKFKYSLDFYLNEHSGVCEENPVFSLVYVNNNMTLCVSCETCCNYYLIKTMET